MAKMMKHMASVMVLTGLLAGCVAVVPLGETKSETKTATKQKT